MIAATHWQLEFSGSAFAWWAVVSAAVGVGLIVNAFLVWHDDRAGHEAKGGGKELGRGGGLSLVAAHEPLRVFGFSGALVSGMAGAVSLALTAAMVAWGMQAHLAALLWTVLMVMVGRWFFYRRVHGFLSRWRLTSLVLLRAAGLLFLVVMLFAPALGVTVNPETRAKLAVVVDASGSMSVSDQPNEPNRYRQSVLAVQNVLIPRLKDVYDIQMFAYDGKHPEGLKSAEEFDGISPNGTVTDLTAGIGLGTSGDAAQVVLFSDGIHNGPATVASGLSNSSVPVHTVSVGSSMTEPSTVPDIAVVSVDGPQTATVNNQITLTASIKSTAMSDRTIRVLLMNGSGGGQMDEQRLVLRSGPTPQTVQLKFTPDKVGRMVVRVQVPVDPSQRSEANNTQDYPLLVTDPKLAVLYIEGRVRPEVGPLRRTLEQDPNINAISMVQTQAGKFELRGVKEGDDLKGIPTTLAQWKRFKVVIIGDLDASFLNGQQQRDLQQAVKEGTGLLMIGGFAPGGWEKTLLSDMLPVNLAKVEPAQINAAFVPELTAVGAGHPIFRGIAGYFMDPAGKAAAQQMPALSGCVAVAGAKGGAMVLAVHPTEKIHGEPAIVLAAEQYSQGRTAAFAADTTWRWNLSLRGMGKDSPYNRFWGQMVRWLAGQEDLAKKSGPSVTAMIPKERYEAGEEVKLRCAVTDKQGQSTNYANVWADVKSPDGKSPRVVMSVVQDQIGVYEGTYRPTLAGTYKVGFGATKDGADLGKDASSFSIRQAAGEMDVLAAQPGTMQEISRITGGDHAELSGVAALADRLANRTGTTAVATETKYPLYENHAFFLLFVAALTAEWFLRRKWQLQ